MNQFVAKVVTSEGRQPSKLPFQTQLYTVNSPLGGKLVSDHLDPRTERVERLPILVLERIVRFKSNKTVFYQIYMIFLFF